MPITYSNVGGAEPSTVTFKAATVQITRGSTNEQQEIICLGDPQTSNAQAGVLNTTPAGNVFGLSVRLVGGPSSAADLVMRPVFSSTSTDNPVTISGNSTVVVSAFAAALISSAVPAAGTSGLVVQQVGYVAPSTTVTVAAFPANSSQVEVRALPANTSQVEVTKLPAGLLSTSVPAAASSGLNVWMVGGNRINIGSTAADNAVLATIGTNLQSSAAPSSGSSGLVVREVFDNRLTATSTSAFATSTQFTISGSTTAAKYVVGYSITSTDLTATSIKFMGGSTLVWAVRLQAMTSGVTGANMAVGNGYLFKSDAASSFTLQISGSSRAGWAVGISYFLAP